ncbi:unnamed protein product [Caenorhabditis angaria]|uniref:BTB domain-containing protein n=1 Tax=Caenorhabditis angaria TaxID=860376 RepID=A0A9P1I4J8_9PELO|nr:unnamed protein product [Caenorhabditis angaria]
MGRPPKQKCLVNIKNEQETSSNYLNKNGNCKIIWHIDSFDVSKFEKLESHSIEANGLIWKLMLHRPEDENGFQVYYKFEMEKKTKAWFAETEVKKVAAIFRNDLTVANPVDENYCIHDSDSGFLTADDDDEPESITIELNLSVNSFDFSKQIPGYTDLGISVNGTIFYVNRWILCSGSQYFFDLFVNQKSMQCILQFDDFSEIEMFEFLASLSFTPIKLSVHNIEVCMKMANFFDVSSIRSRCEKFILNCSESAEDPFQKMSLCRKVQLSEKYDYKEVLEECLEQLTSSKQIKRFVGNTIFEELEKDTRLIVLKKLLKYV